MTWIETLPLRRKLTVIILATCATVLLFAVAALALFEIVAFRRGLVREAHVLGELLGRNAQAALSFRDEAAATTILAALAANPDVVAARIYDGNGTAFADYRRSPEVEPMAERPEADGHHFVAGHLMLTHPIVLDGRRIGSIALRVDLSGMYERLGLFAGLVGLVLLGSLLVALAMSARLQQPVTGPILALADIARSIADRQDYSVRAIPHGSPEVVSLTDAFNHMLAQIDEQNRRLRQQAEELMRSNAELEQFTYISSHDLKEPLRMVTMYMSLLERKHGPALDPEARRFVQFAVEGAARLQQLIEDILTYARLDRPESPLATVPLEEVMAEALANNRSEIERLQARILVASLPQVTGDRMQLVQLFQNLIANAIKFHGEPPPRIEISAERHGPHWHIAVRDHGIGIAAAYQQRIFDMFQRLHSREEYPGTGIGLAICRKIVERHGGAIWVESAVGAGSTFHVSLRVAGE